MLDALRQVIRQALHSLRTAPGVTAAAVLSLALGIGANTAIFSLIDALMLKALPVSHPEQLLQVTMATPQFFSNPIWEEIRDRQDVFARVFAYGRWGFNLSSGGEARTANGLFASGQYFDTLGIRPALGRTLVPADDHRGCPGAAVLSHGFWQKEYGGRADIVGRTISLDNHPIAIVGVAEAGYTGTDVGVSFDVVVPLCAERVIHGETSNLDFNAAPGNYNTIFAWLRIVGRPKAGLSPEQVAARLSVLAPHVYQATVPKHWRPPEQARYLERKLAVEPFAHGLSYIRDQYHDALLILMATVGIVLLIACANVANLLLARGVTRRREFAIKLALGAGRDRLIRQMLTESLLLAGASAVLGVLFANWVTAMLIGFLDLTLDTAPDPRVLAFTAGVALLTSLLFGLAPALRSTSVSPYSAMRWNARDLVGGTRFGTAKALVTVQIALSLLLLVGAGLMLTTFWKLMALDTGFRADEVLLTGVDLRSGHYEPGLRRAVYLRMLAALRTLPGVRSASASDVTPICGCASKRELALEAEGGERAPVVTVHSNFVSDSYFQTLDTPIVAGRDFNEHDGPDAPQVAIVNRTLAERYFGPGNPLGRRFRVQKGNTLGDAVAVVGVAADAKYGSLREVIPPTVYFAWNQDATPYPRTNFELRSAGGAPAGLIDSVKTAIGQVDPRASIEFTPLAARIEESISRERLLAILSACFGALALLLAAIGLYGVISYSVARRSNEIGIRMALGAHPAGVLRMVLREVVLMVAAGLAAGLGLAATLTRFVASFLYDLKPADPLTFSLAAAVLAGIAVFAGYWPARRAARVDPMTALREE
ncbi:ABC transporter permease [uncultured Paludibaculum sp.]|uniref:ABC transporter permease n=1 Tax=uncultured Paludibaculum sp. TaxID=1765020 RepID=UPI002AABB690|nr:ABC transporter permease [uncultured Paludibaculum sp.]